MTKRNLSVPMGRSFIPWTAPEDVVFPVSRGVRPPRGTPEEALLEPEGSPSLGALSADASRIAVVLPDATRLWQNVPLMAEALRAEIEKNTATPVTWMIGAGLHRSPSREETALLLGGASRPGDRVLWSDPAGVRDTGLRTSRGTPVAAPPEALDADLLVLAGGIGYHDLAGFSGGRKALFFNVRVHQNIPPAQEKRTAPKEAANAEDIAAAIVGKNPWRCMSAPIRPGMTQPIHRFEAGSTLPAIIFRARAMSMATPVRCLP
jgi:hypothetical protein